MGPCGRWKDGVVWIVGREAGAAAAAAAAAQSAGEYVGGVWPLSPRAAPGPAGYQKPGIFFFFFLARPVAENQHVCVAGSIC